MIHRSFAIAGLAAITGISVWAATVSTWIFIPGDLVQAVDGLADLRQAVALRRVARCVQVPVKLLLENRLAALRELRIAPLVEVGQRADERLEPIMRDFSLAVDLSSRGGLTAGGRGNREFGVRRWIVRELGG